MTVLHTVCVLFVVVGRCVWVMCVCVEWMIAVCTTCCVCGVRVFGMRVFNMLQDVHIICLYKCMCVICVCIER